MTGEEMERAIEFLLKNQASYEARSEKTELQLAQIGVRVEQLTGMVEQLTGTVERLSGTVGQLIGTVEQLSGTVGQLSSTVGQVSGTVGQVSETVEQLSGTVEQLSGTVEQMSVRVEKQIASMAESHTEFMHTMLGYVEAQGQTNADMRQSIRELSQAQQRTQQEISDLTKVVSNLIKFSSGNGNPPQE